MLTTIPPSLHLCVKPVQTQNFSLQKHSLEKEESQRGGERRERGQKQEGEMGGEEMRGGGEERSREQFSPAIKN